MSIGACIDSYIHSFLRNVITYSCSNFSGGLTTSLTSLQYNTCEEFLVCPVDLKARRCFIHVLDTRAINLVNVQSLCVSVRARAYSACVHACVRVCVSDHLCSLCSVIG